jgi:hypothetical protein
MLPIEIESRLDVEVALHCTHLKCDPFLIITSVKTGTLAQYLISQHRGGRVE